MSVGLYKSLTFKPSKNFSHPVTHEQIQSQEMTRFPLSIGHFSANKEAGIVVIEYWCL